MKLPNRILGIVAMLASPFLLAELSITREQGNTSRSGIYDLIYMTGWMCTIVGLLRIEATGKSRKNKIVLYVQLVLLTIANIWNSWTIINPGNRSIVYFILDFFWPLSNLCLLIIGIIVMVKAVLRGWKRYIVLVAGLWLPFMILTMLVLGKQWVTTVSGIYSMLSWFIMGYMIFTFTPVTRYGEVRKNE